MKEFWEKNVVNNHFVVALGVVGLAWVLWEIKSVIVALFFAYIIKAALAPSVEKLVAMRFKRVLAVITVYFLSLAMVLLVAAPLVPFLVRQVQGLIVNFPFFLARASSALGYSFGVADVAAVLQSEFDAIGRNTLAITKTVFSGFFSTVTVAVLSLYFLLDRNRIHEAARRVFSFDLLPKIEHRLGAWIRGQLALSLAVGLLTFVGLSILGLPFAFPLAIIAGILEIVPIIGPIVSAIPAVIVALTISPVGALTIVGLYVGVQLLENNLLVPKIMQKAVGLDPAVVITGIMAGGALFGVVGSLLAVPVILVARTVIEASA